MATRLTDASQQAAADAVVDRVDGGAGAGLLRIYDGAQPADADDAPSGTLLVEFTLADPAFGNTATSGTATANGLPLTASAAATGTAASARIVDSAGTTVVDGSVTATGGGGDIELDNTSINSGQTVELTALDYTHPASE